MHFSSAHQFLSLIFSLARLSKGAIYYPDPLASRLEHLLVDTDGAYKSGLKDAITPCSNYVNGLQNTGRQTSAQWVRAAFHDFITANVDEGTGGLDASIGFETMRDENTGTAFNDTFSFLAQFVDQVTSMSDLLALSVVLSFAHCGYVLLDFRGGRIDATEAGPSGVPQPESDLNATLQFFANAGLNASQAIALTACGHAIGHVSHESFPQVVKESAVTPDNTQGGIALDDTPFLSDNSVVLEYLGNLGQRGGPLVTSDNITVRSDLRLYESDENTTMEYLAYSGFDRFAYVCGDVLEKMINTVPKDVVLSDPIKVQEIKIVNMTFDTEHIILNSAEKVLYGDIRYLKEEPQDLSFTITNPDNNFTSSTTVSAFPRSTGSSVSKGSSIFGTTWWSGFHFNIHAGQGPPTRLTIANSTNDTILDIPLQSSLFFVPRQSGPLPGWEAGNYDYLLISAALLTNLAEGAFVGAVVHVPEVQEGTLAPKVMNYSIGLRYSAPSGDYQIFDGSIGKDLVPGNLWEKVSIDVTAQLKNGTIITDPYNFINLGDFVI